ncbi:RHS repeat-associated core domain-containing protein [Pseudomonas putida]|uniref:RHS repeat-associated core domain-containing protein n=1 Tax=Pseudomonas putida TaxID=303 RepID=UPI0026AD2D64
MLSTLTKDPSAVEALFTPGGQQAVLLLGQPLAWTSRAELEQVVSVKREGATDDGENYRYDSRSQRVLKANTQQTARSTQAQRVIYLPGLELRTHTHGDTLKQDLQVMTVGEASRAQVRVLHWQAGKPDDLPNDQLRYSYDNLLGSSALEVDGAGNLISQEEYYPFGGTAVWAARNEVEASYKTVRYSGKERDATGLYYYGYRYYQPWAGRWLSADPAGTVDGLNIFRMVCNNPISSYDEDGLERKHFRGADDRVEKAILKEHPTMRIVARGLTEYETINPEFAAKISQAQSIAVESLRRAVEYLQQSQGDDEKFNATVVKQIMDVPLDGGYLQKGLTAILDMQRSRLEAGNDQIVIYNDPKVEAGVNAGFYIPVDEHRRLFINEQIFSRIKDSAELMKSLVATLIHEDSHARTKSLDIFYSEPNLPKTTGLKDIVDAIRPVIGTALDIRRNLESSKKLQKTGKNELLEKLEGRALTANDLLNNNADSWVAVTFALSRFEGFVSAGMVRKA